MSYYNTTHEKGADLKQSEAKAQSQEEKILEIFREVITATPSIIWGMDLQHFPLTSIRRAITNLTKQGKLYRTSLQGTGYYGKPEYYWSLATKQTSLF